MGTGTTFYGQRDVREDGSYITTEWVVFLFLPIFPLRSLRVRKGVTTEKGCPPVACLETTNYVVLGVTRPDWRQVLCTYGFSAFVFAWMIPFAILYSPLASRFGDTITGMILFIGYMVPVSIPPVLCARRRSSGKRPQAPPVPRGGPVAQTGVFREFFGDPLKQAHQAKSVQPDVRQDKPISTTNQKPPGQAGSLPFKQRSGT